MAISIAIWSQDVKPKDTVVILPVADLRITNIALGETLADKNGRTTVKLVYQAPNVSDDEDEEKEDEDSDAEGKSEAVATILCSLTPGKIESATIDLILNEGEEYILETVGPNVVHLTGNYIDQNPLTAGPDDYSDMDSEDEFDLQDVSSDVEINPDDIEMDGDSDASRFEEVTDEAPKSAKRALEEESVSKAEKKKNKKQKAANGEAVPTGEEEEKPKSKKEKKEKAEKEAPKPAVAEKELPGGLKVKDAKVGSGPAAKKGKRVEMRYIGKFPNGKVFDSNTKGKPFAFRLGGGEVIKGWDEGIVGMQVGGERVLTVPPALAYGKKGVAGIPSNSTLIFEVKLLSVK